MKIINYILLFFFVLQIVQAQSAYEIAKKDLKLNYKEIGISAGQSHFNDIWARDAFFASFGSVAIKDYDITKKQIETFAQYQREDGLIPLRIGDRSIILKFIGIDFFSKPKAVYSQDKNNDPALDQNCLYIISSWNYIEKYGDWSTALKYYPNFKQAITWLDMQDTNKNNLVEEKNYANWADSLKTNGEVLYTNVCYYKALDDMEKIATLGASAMSIEPSKNKLLKDAQIFRQKKEEVKKAIQENFYNGEYFIHSYNDDEKRSWFSSDGNILAILWDVADQNQSEKILHYIEKQNDNHFTIALNYPKIESKYIYFPFRIIAMQKYHNGEVLWPWIGQLHCLAREKTFQDGKMCLEKIDEIYLRDEIIYETYDKKEKPLDTLFYNSEEHFAWSSGLYLYVYDIIYSKSS